ncbi:hypothetical protein ACLB2K_011108 [Fragaria x ananassa]
MHPEIRSRHPTLLHRFWTCNSTEPPRSSHLRRSSPLPAKLDVDASTGVPSPTLIELQPSHSPERAPANLHPGSTIISAAAPP